MADTNAQSPSSNIEQPSAPLLARTPCSCGSLQSRGSTPTSPYDKWIRRRPNTEWQKTENQAFIDYEQFDNVPFDDEDDDDSDGEEGQPGSSDELSDAEGSDNESEGEDCAEENDTARKHNAACINLDCPGLPDKEVLGADYISDSQLPASARQESPTRSPDTVHCGSAGPKDSIVKRFLGVIEDPDMRRDSITRLRRFFKTATLGELEGGAGEKKESRILLEDRNFTEKSFRPYPRSMTPKKLYSALREQRYPATTPSTPAAATPKSWTKSKDCQVETRKLHVSNPNEWSALVLAATASPTQAPVLFNFIDQYLKFETSISVDPNVGFMFHFQFLKFMCPSDISQPDAALMTLWFQLPFYTLRERQYTDSRQDHENNPLRQSFEVPCMQLPETSQHSSHSSGWICESQVSVLVSIVDLHGWTAYAFEDTYCNPREPSEELDIFCSKPRFYFPDALTAGSLDSTRYLEPRKYFLRVFEVRIRRACLEWHRVVDRLGEVVKRHRPDRIFHLSSDLINRRNSKRDKQIILQQRYSEWISKIMNVVSDQSSQLSTTLTAWDEFEKRCSKYFPEDAESPSETSTGHTFSEIKKLKDRLDSLGKEISRDQSTLGAQLAVENTGTAKFVKALTVISILMMPMILNIALFSIQPGVMPFQMDFLAFVKSFFALALFVCLVWIALSKWDSLMIAAYYAMKSLDRTFHALSRAGSKSADGEEQASETSGGTPAENGENSRMDGVPSQTGTSFWRLSNPQLLVRRGQRGAPVTEVELQPVGLATIVCD